MELPFALLVVVISKNVWSVLHKLSHKSPVWLLASGDQSSLTCLLKRWPRPCSTRVRRLWKILSRHWIVWLLPTWCQMKADHLFYLVYEFHDHELNRWCPISWFVEVPFPAWPGRNTCNFEKFYLGTRLSDCYLLGVKWKLIISSIYCTSLMITNKTVRILSADLWRSLFQRGPRTLPKLWKFLSPHWMVRF